MRGSPSPVWFEQPRVQILIRLVIIRLAGRASTSNLGYLIYGRRDRGRSKWSCAFTYIELNVQMYARISFSADIFVLIVMTV